MGVGYSPKIITNGLVLCLDAGNRKSYSGSGTIWKDLSGNNNNGILTNSPTFNSENCGNIILNGSSQYIDILSQPLSNNSSFSLACWINLITNSKTYAPLIDSGSIGNGTIGYALSIESPVTRIYAAADAGYSSVVNNFLLGQWYYVVATAQNGSPYQIKIYINSILQTQVAGNNTNSLTMYGSAIRLGYSIRNTNNYLNAKYSMVKIYNRTLSASEVLQNYNATKGRFNL